MDDSRTPMDPDEAAERFAEMLDKAALPRFSSTAHDSELNELQLIWEHGFTIHVDLTRRDIEPFDDFERASILGEPYCCPECEPIHVVVSGSEEDPRASKAIPGVEIHRVPPLHPDDVTTIRGIPVTSPSRTLIDLAEVVGPAELREAFSRAKEMGLLDPEAVRASRARVEWRPSLEMLDEVIAEFCD